LIGPGLVAVDALVVDLKGAVRQGDGMEEEERPVLVGADPLERLAADQVLGVDGPLAARPCCRRCRQVDPPVVVVEICGEIAVRMALAIVTEEMIEAVLERLPVVSNMPMPHLPMQAVA